MAVDNVDSAEESSGVCTSLFSDRLPRKHGGAKTLRLARSLEVVDVSFWTVRSSTISN